MPCSHAASSKVTFYFQSFNQLLNYLFSSFFTLVFVMHMPIDDIHAESYKVTT